MTRVAVLTAAILATGATLAHVDRAAATIACGTGVNACKACSAVVPGVFRDTMPVPSTWSSQSCLTWAKQVGGTQWQLGCVTNAKLIWALPQAVSDPGPVIPSPNCGW